MPNIPLNDIVRQVRLQWRLDDSRAAAVVDRAMQALGIQPARSLLGGKSLTPDQYRLLLEWLNEHGLG
jgi:hypothetical protein